MARISNYDNDATVSGTDKVIGTDSSTTFTKNFRVIDLAEFFFSSLSGDVSVDSNGVVSVSSVGTLGSNSGNYVATLTARNGITSSGATSGATVNHILDVNSTQTHITSILNAGLCIGRDSDNKICFTTDNEIRLTVNGVLDLILAENSLTPGSSDGTALGTTSLMWSDLFLASGAIINFNNGNLTLTHSSNALTLSGSDKLQFGDDATYIHQSADSVLDLVSDGELELNATTEVEINTALVDVNASGAVTIDAGGDSNITVTGSLDVDASAALTIDSATSIGIGTSEDKPIDIDSTTLDIDASDAVTIDGTSISIDGNTASNLTVTGSGESLTLEATGGGTQQVVINSAGTSTSAVDINATAGGIDIDASGALAIDSATSISIGTNADKPVAIDSTTFALDAASTVVVDGTGISIDGILDSNFTVNASGQSLNLTVSGGGTQVLSLDSAGTGTNAIDINATGGGVDIVAAANVSMLATTSFVAQGNTSATFGDDTEQIAYDGSGNLDIDAVTLDLDSSGAINILAAGNASDITIKTEHVAGPSFHLDANSDVGSIVDIDAGILNIASDGLTSMLSASTFDIDAAGAVTIDGSAITIGADDTGVAISIGHTTSETTVNDNLNVTGTLKINAGDQIITFPTARGSNNQVLKTDGSGVLSFGDPSSGVTVADSTANTDFPIVFHDESNNLLDDTNAFEYNPSTGLLTVNKLTPKTNAAGDIGSSTVAYNNLFLANGTSNGTSVIEFIQGVGNRVRLTHIDNGVESNNTRRDGSLRLSATSKLEFNDASQFINAPTATKLNIVANSVNNSNAAEGEIQIDANLLLDINAATTDVSNALIVGGNLSFTNDGNHDIVVNSTSAGTAGKYLAISAGSSAAGSTNTNGGDLFLQSGNGDGNGSSDIVFKTKTSLGGDSVIERMRINNSGIDIAAPLDLNAAANHSMLLYNGSKWIDNVMSGHATMANTGVITLANNSVGHAKYQDVPTDTIIGRTAAGSGDVTALTAGNVRGIINVEEGAQVNAVTSIVAGGGIDVSAATGDVTVTAEGATTDNPGVVELATTAETTTGTDTTRAITANGLKDATHVFNELITAPSFTSRSTSPVLLLNNSDTTIEDDDVIGKIQFQASSEGSGTLADDVVVSIEAEAGVDFTSSANRTTLNFKVANNGTASTILQLFGQGVLSLAGRFQASGTLTGSNFITSSDRRLKSEIEPIKEGLEVIKQFTSYNYIKGGEKESGFIAQEVQKVLPHTVYENSDGMLSMSDRGVVAHMHKAILELEKRLISIEEKLK